ncbi:hypothetical protein COP2_043185 [Malus domestica]
MVFQNAEFSVYTCKDDRGDNGDNRDSGGVGGKGSNEHGGGGSNENAKNQMSNGDCLFLLFLSVVASQIILFFVGGNRLNVR